MRRALVLLVILAASCSRGQQPVAQAESKEEVCSVAQELARKTMEARQAGVSMSDMLANKPTELLRRLTIAAYETPRYQSPEFVQRAIDDFSNDTYLACIKE